MNKYLLLFLLLSASTVMKGQTDTLLVTSQRLERSVRVIIYDALPAVGSKPIVYLTDGEKMIAHGVLDQLAKLTQADSIPPAYYVFVSTLDPETGFDRRNEYFFCNPTYLAFFEQELMPTVEKRWNTSFSPENRSLVGVSFGGLNAAYFSATSGLFQHYGLLSPITYPCPDIAQQIAFSDNKDLKVFLSTGQQDAESYLDPLEQMYRSNGYRVKTLRTQGGHDFDNWNAQLSALVNYLIP